MRNSELIKLLYKIEPQAGLSKEEFIIKEITKLQVLFAAEMKRNEKKKIITYGDLEKIVLNNSTYVTYLEAVRNLKINIRLLSNLSYLKENIVNLENKAIGSSIERLRIGLAPNMSENEYKLENFRLRAKLLLLHNIEIK
ncbi:MAG: hypothetical protein MJA82_06275, partial [Clostridia bacterium]|nr:hypothetical protein [Clostridia bacterium]